MPETNGKKLNLGCGRDIKPGWVNLDAAALPGVDVICDIEKNPLPFPAGEFDYVLADGILEHVDYLPILKEIYRVLKAGGVAEIKVPHFTSRYFFIDPTHKHSFSFQTFEFFIKGAVREYYFDFHFKKLLQSKIIFEKKFLPYNWVIEALVNLNRRTKQLYEATFLSRLFPAVDIIAKLVK